jgi:hypothetical protein
MFPGCSDERRFSESSHFPSDDCLEELVEGVAADEGLEIRPGGGEFRPGGGGVNDGTYCDDGAGPIGRQQV